MASAILTQFLSTEYLIPLFLVTIFIASLISSKIRIPYTMVLVGVGIAISLSHFTGLNFGNIAQFKVDPRLILVFIVPPLIFEAMMKIKHEEFKQVQISALLLSTVGVLLATLMESEASFNEATGVRIFSAISAIAVAQGSILGTNEVNAEISLNIIDEL